MKILVTGSAGFIGRNLTAHLSRLPEFECLEFDRTKTDSRLRELLAEADGVVHLAGVNRPTDPAEFDQVNAGLTARVCEHLEALGKPVPILLASSAQAQLDNPYGASKRAAETIVREYGRRVSASVAISRLPGVFGKWCRPHYNSVVATFCHNAARDLPLRWPPKISSLRAMVSCMVLAPIHDDAVQLLNAIGQRCRARLQNFG